MIEKRWAYISLTGKGLERCKELRSSLEVGGDILALEKRATSQTDRRFSNFQEMMACAFSEYDVLLCLMAAGIVVRTLAPLIESKTSDPAVLVMDEPGQFCISLLSGHLGNANECARLVEEKTGAAAVITTASDTQGSIAVDTLAMNLGMSIDDLAAAKDVTAALVNEGKVLINRELTEIPDMPDNLVAGDVMNSKGCAGMILIDPYESGMSIMQIEDLKERFPCVCLQSPGTVIGVGCRRGVSKETVLKAIRNFSRYSHLPLESISRMATVDVKQDEEGILAAADELGAELKIIKRPEIAEVEKLFRGSDFVKQTIGVSAVAEPCGYLASGKGTLVCSKNKMDGVTVSIWRIK